MSDPWAEMDEWCQRRTGELCKVAEQMLAASGYDTDQPEYRTVLGQSQAFHRMRSYIHGARAAGSDECICPKCGLRHGGRSISDPGF